MAVENSVECCDGCTDACAVRQCRIELVAALSLLNADRRNKLVVANLGFGCFENSQLGWVIFVGRGKTVGILQLQLQPVLPRHESYTFTLTCVQDVKGNGSGAHASAGSFLRRMRPLSIIMEIWSFVIRLITTWSMSG